MSVCVCAYILLYMHVYYIHSFFYCSCDCCWYYYYYYCWCWYRRLCSCIACSICFVLLRFDVIVLWLSYMCVCEDDFNNIMVYYHHHHHRHLCALFFEYYYRCDSQWELHRIVLEYYIRNLRYHTWETGIFNCDISSIVSKECHLESLQCEQRTPLAHYFGLFFFSQKYNKLQKLTPIKNTIARILSLYYIIICLRWSSPPLDASAYT